VSIEPIAHAEPALLRRLGDAVDIAVATTGAALALLMTANVAGRALLNSDISANVELGEFLLVWATFLGGASAARRGAHMRIVEGLLMMPTGLRRHVEIAIRFLVLAVLGALVWNGAKIAEVAMDQTTTVLYWPVGLGYAAMPVGSALAFVFVAHETWRLWRGESAPDLGDD
jgi:TRAP-type C4-dicarboxylate transport system permease small subunit